MLDKSGIATLAQVKSVLPTAKRRAKGPYAVIECFQEIPCNPCSTSCPFGAILPMENINDLPQIDYDLCTGCSICAGVCPGLAIFIIDESTGAGLGTVTLPYEFSPLPKKGDLVSAVDRAGNSVTEATVVRINHGKRTRTPLITISVPLERVHDVRFINPIPIQEQIFPEFLDDSPPTPLVEQTDEQTIICRCEGITLGEIRQLIREGYTTVDEIKRVSRAGMGPCQARTCGPLIAGEIARMTGTPIEEVEPSAHRPPVKPLPISFFMEEGD